jgi:hypothetical protein
MKFLKKTALLIIFLAALLLPTVGLKSVVMQEADVTKVLTIINTNPITIGGRSIASIAPVFKAFKDLEIFVSEKESPGFKFTSVGGSWIEFSHDLQVEAEVRFEIEGEWTSWIELEEEEDTLTPPSEGRGKYATAATNPAESFQYKFILHGDEVSSPIVKDIEWTFIKTVSSEKLENQKISALADSAEIEKYAAYSMPSSKVVSRAEWGANESYRYVGDNSIDVKLEYDADFHAKYAEELQYSKIVGADESGDKYKWPLQYPEKVEKFIIHHTATTKTLDDPKQAIRDIYYYHAVKRGWGDIGYNYIVDQDGIVYEGRSGGEGVIGGHSGPGNHGSIGIAILGNFEEASVPEKLFLPIGQFIYKKAQIHGINPLGTSMFRGKDMENVFGHRDIMPTTCPGQYLYEKLPVIRALAAQDFTKKQKFVQDYDIQNSSEIYFIELNPEETRGIIIKMENIGTKDWGADTVLKFQQFDDFDGTVSFIGSENDTIAKMQEAVVKSGNTATFKFKIQSNKKSLNSSLNLSLLIDGKTKLKDALTIPLTVAQPIYKFDVVETKYPPKIMKTGEGFEGYVKLKNTGNVTWKKLGVGKIELREDQNSEFLTKKTKILATLVESTVKPGGIATFKLKLKAPSKGGYYNEVFKPVIKDAVFISQNLSFETIVYEKDYDGALVAKTLVSKWEKGKIYTISVKLRNVGSKPWNKKDLSVAFLKEKDLKINDLTLSPSEVKTGEVGEINFNAVVDANEDVGEKNMFLRPRLKGKAFLPLPVSITYTVVEEKLKETTESPDIRVKLSFPGNTQIPEITANGTFEIYSGNVLLTTLNAGSIAEVEIKNGKYQIKAEEIIFLKDEPTRFVPKSNSILQIKNFEHRPAWNLDLNDNEYRGILEVREVDGSLVVINELELESYLKGLGEVSNSELTEKIKAIAIAARTYAKYYIDVDEKFPGKPYSLDDDPNTSQKYLGYGFEKRSPNVSAAVDATYGKIVIYEGTIVKTPYFNQTDGTKTKSAKEVWNWDAPYLISVDDSYCSGTEFLGHGVGISGCGAKGMAEQGFTYEEILKHYYTGIEISKSY